MGNIDKNFILNVIKNSNYSELSSKAAEISFYLLLSIFPFSMFTISIVVYIPIFHLNKYINILRSIMPESAFNIISLIMNSAMENRSLGLIIMSFFLTIWTSSRAVKSLIKGINKSYKINETRSFLKVLIIAFLFTIILLALIFSSMVFLIYGEKIGYFIFTYLGLNNIFIKVWDICRYTIGIFTVVIILVSLYKYTPNKKITAREAIPGAIIATFVWILVSLLYSYYTNRYSNYEIIYGSIGEIIILMTWLYISSWAIIIGYEVNARLYFSNLYLRKGKNK